MKGCDTLRGGQNLNDAFSRNTVGSCCVPAVHLGPVHATPEEFENASNVFRPHTTEEVKNNYRSFWIYV